MKTILVPVDLSAATSRVCDAACALARMCGARLVLLHVVQPPTPLIVYDYYAFDTGLMAKAIAAGEKFAARKLLALGRRCERRGLKVQAVQCTGQPLATILDKAAETKAAYIVIGSHGHGAVFDLLAGSTTQGVLRKARQPVLVVPMGRR